MLRSLLEECTLCPRNCCVDRTKGQRGYCNATGEIFVARAALHMWEEPCISGAEGSGTVFFSGCSVRCVYCQNHIIAGGRKGKKISVGRLAEIFIELQDKKANNVNLVTPSHYLPQIIEAITIARDNGLSIPIVYNSSCYEKAESIKLLEGYVDVYLPDFKYMSPEPAKRYSACGDYFEYASLTLREMVRQAGEPVFDGRGIIRKGVIVRHLALPGYTQDSKNIIKYLYERYGDAVYISIMNQYTPMGHIESYPELNRKLTAAEYDELVDYAISLGVQNGFIQEGETASESFIPDFNGEGV